MSEIWANGPSRQSDRFVLLALADYANDEGECWPSIAGIMEKVCMSERGVQTVIRRLQADGWLEISVGSGRKNCNAYTIKNPAGNAPRRKCTPQMDAETPQMDAKNPAGDAPEPSRTINNRQSNKNAREVRGILLEVAGSEAVDSFIAYRSKSKGKALTVTAAKRLAKNLTQIFQNGGDADDALGLAEERSWLTVTPEWYFNAKGRKNDNRTHQHQQTPHGRQNRPDPALENIFRLAGLGEASGNGGC